ncbi:MAG: cell surface protein SprA [Melioribacteraceae bacterium]|nr:cell surface protein SprA [Melioribacteraceae bacterium]MCF8355379.1 cell surface protein SprA [Melioribacteraceae bacterium]MCF8394624.1 cell surface protein SprA [Melioribacteraceae bacterium]MCF8419621.1 cell surface protein SprA [Melioribacteraceae bacterium]
MKWKRVIFSSLLIFAFVLLVGFTFGVEPVGYFKHNPHLDYNNLSNSNFLAGAGLHFESAIKIKSAELFLPGILPDSTTLNDSSSLQDSTYLDSLAFADSLLADTMKVDSMALDSTARIKHYKHSRNDLIYTPFNRYKSPSLYLNPSDSRMKRTVELDSTGQYVIIKEVIAGVEPRPYLKIPLEEYIDLRMEAVNQGLWEEIGYAYELRSGKKDLSELLTDITNINIPLPSASFLSIFGPPVISLRINGSVDIHGAWRNETTEGLTASRLGNTRNEPDFKQQVQINVDGTIGDKLTISADWNTERTFEYENQLKIQYTGYDDEIIQSIEAGNVSLQTSSLVGGSEALFGIKSKFQLGPLTLTALASQKKGEIEEVSVSGGAQSQKFEVHAYEYSKNHYFLDEIYTDTSDLNFFNRYYGNATYTPTLQTEQYRVKDIEVWKSTNTRLDPANERKANVYIDLEQRNKGELYGASHRDTTQTTVNGETVINSRFIRLIEGVDFEYNEYVGFVTFKTQIQKDDIIGVAYRREGPTSDPNDDVFYGEFLNDVSTDTSSIIVLKLIKPKDLKPTFTKAWNLQLRNIYPMGGRDIKKEGFQLDIRYSIPGQEPVNDYLGIKLLEAFGLDQTDESGTGTSPDGAFDFLPGRTILPSTGEIIFPTLQPFGVNLPDELPDSLKYNSVYDTLDTFAKQDRSKDKFILTGEYSAAISSVYNIGFNVVENSVKVLLNGRELNEGSDYQVDYNIGQVIIRNDQALVPGADLRITYEQNDLFQLASKTLLGLRGEYEFDKKTRLGFSFLNLNEQTLSDKVRIGEEPLNNSIYGVDFQSSFDLPFITDGLDEVFSTSKMSTFNLKGEYAYMSPDPNTKKSPIFSDDGQSIAYIDDFEGSKRIIPLGVSYGGWHDLSVPDSLPYISGITEKLELMNYKAKTYWFNNLPSDVQIKDIWPERQAGREDQQVTVLDFVYNPEFKGSYNYNQFWNPADSLKKNWGGMMTILSSTANNLVEENIEFIEFWLKIMDAPEDVELYIDLGQISEDVIPNRKLDKEDQNDNDLIDEGEDTGIDGKFDGEEPFYDAVNNPDPSGDNFYLDISSNLFDKINGTEGNAALTDIGRLPDSEDLNRNFSIDLLDSYFRYKIPIDTNKTQNEFIVGGGGENDGWYQFRIPLKDFSWTKGDPSFSIVEYIRFWISGVEERVRVRFAEMNLVGNQWQKVVIPGKVAQDDSVLSVSTINVEDNPGYSSPPGVIRERDRSKPDEEVFKNEQSLMINIDRLPDGETREAVKYLFRPLDIFDYKEMKLFIHGPLDNHPGSISNYVDETNYSSEIYFRFGTDSSNFYEYRQPVKADWNEIQITFEELTAIKQRRDVENRLFQVPVEGEPGHFYGVRGKPTLTRVTYFMIGIVNPGNKGSVGEFVSGELWINELRVLGADDTPGWAYTASTSMNFADLFDVSFNISQTDPNFHRLSERFGSRVDKRNWGMSVGLDVLKLIPANLEGSNLKVNYQRSESISKPVYLPGTDINVDEAARQLTQKLNDNDSTKADAQKAAEQLKSDAQTISVSETWTLSNMKFKIPTKSWLIEDTFNQLSFNFNYNKKKGRNPTTLNNQSWVWNASIKYSVNLSNKLFFKPVDIPIIGTVIDLFSDYKDVKIYFAPSSINAGISANRKYSFQKSRTIGTKSNIQRDFTATRNYGFNWKLTEGAFWNLSFDLDVDINSSLAYLLTAGEVERPEGDVWNDIFNGAHFGKDYNFRQNFSIKTKPTLPSIWNLDKFFQLTAGYSVNYTWQNNFQQEDLGRSAGFSNRIQTGVTIRWKSLTEPLFAEDPKTAATAGGADKRGSRGGTRDLDEEMRKNKQDNQDDEESENDDSQAQQVESAKPDSIDTTPRVSPLTKAWTFIKGTSKYLFFDYDQIRVNFSQSNSQSGSGLLGEGSGQKNFWGYKTNSNYGPSRLFMLGFSYDVGPRAPNGNLQDRYSQKNNVTFSTSRPLWEGATIDLDWNVSWGNNRNTTIQTDELGNIFVSNISSTGSIERSFLSFPPSLFLTIFKSGISRVNELYDAESANPNENLSNAFVEGFESMPLLAKVPFLAEFSKFIPRPNWRINWNGLEKISFFEGFAKRVSLSHAYQSSYSEGWKVNPDGLSEVQTQKINYGFNPLLGLNITFDSFWDGNLNGSIKYGTKTSYDLGLSTRNITETFSRDINISASYSKTGFEIPLFGLSLQNDLEISFSYTSGKNSVLVFEMDNFKEEGKPQDGTTRTTMEPRVKYVMSRRVTLSLFYRRTSVEPEGASRIPPTTTNEAGLDVHIAIQ